MRNYKQRGKYWTGSANADVVAGTGMLIGNLFGVACGNAANGATVTLLTEGVVEIAKTSALAIGVGDRLFWDPVAKLVNKTAAGQVCVGVAVAAAANPSPTVEMKIAPVASTAAGA